MKRINRFSVLILALFVSCTSLNSSKSPEIGNQILIAQYSNSIISKIIEIEFSKNEDLIEYGKLQNFVLENIQLVFFNEANSALVYMGDVNSIDIVNSGEILKDFTMKYSDWETYIVEANIVACYEFSNLKLGKKYIRTEAFKLSNREIININQTSVFL